MSENNIEQYKEQAAKHALTFVRSGMIVGLGHGSTAAKAVHELARLLKEGALRNIKAVPCSVETEGLAATLGIPLTTLEEHSAIDVTIDGADEVDPNLNLIKGGGGALLREKIVAMTTRQEIIIVDERKLAPTLGTTFPLPVEVVPFARRIISDFLKSLCPKVTLRMKSNGQEYRTDQNNIIFDCKFDSIPDPYQLAAKLSVCPGIVEHGLFLNLAAMVIVAGPNGVRVLQRPKQ
jgi:ribose 5-phosphate isomerase A